MKSNVKLKTPGKIIKEPEINNIPQIREIPAAVTVVSTPFKSSKNPKVIEEGRTMTKHSKILTAVRKRHRTDDVEQINVTEKPVKIESRSDEEQRVSETFTITYLENPENFCGEKDPLAFKNTSSTLPASNYLSSVKIEPERVKNVTIFQKEILITKSEPKRVRTAPEKSTKASIFCPICEDKLSSKWTYEMHMKLMHKNSKIPGS